MMEVNKTYKGDCLEIMPLKIASKSIDLILKLIVPNDPAKKRIPKGVIFSVC